MTTSHVAHSGQKPFFIWEELKVLIRHLINVSFPLSLLYSFCFSFNSCAFFTAAGPTVQRWQSSQLQISSNFISISRLQLQLELNCINSCLSVCNCDSDSKSQSRTQLLVPRAPTVALLLCYCCPVLCCSRCCQLNLPVCTNVTFESRFYQPTGGPSSMGRHLVAVDVSHKFKGRVAPNGQQLLAGQPAVPVLAGVTQQFRNHLTM